MSWLCHWMMLRGWPLELKMVGIQDSCFHLKGYLLLHFMPGVRSCAPVLVAAEDLHCLRSAFRRKACLGCWFSHRLVKGLLHALGTCIRMKPWPSMVWIAQLTLGWMYGYLWSGVGQIASPCKQRGFWVSWFLKFRFSGLDLPLSAWDATDCFSFMVAHEVFFYVAMQWCCRPRQDAVWFWLLFGRIIRKFLSRSWCSVVIGLRLKLKWISIAAVLDSIICSHSEAVIVSPDIEAPETPWYDQPIADPKCDLCLQVSVSTVTLIDVDGSSFLLDFRPGPPFLMFCKHMPD